MILRKKAISVKALIDSQGYLPNEAPSVYYVALTSCDKYGRPELPVGFFDGATKRSFMKHDIQVITVHDLLVDFKQAYPNWDGKSDIFPRSSGTDHEENQRLTKVFEDSYEKLIAKKMDSTQFLTKMNQSGINSDNAYQEVMRRVNNPNYEVTLLDIYIMLFSFIERHRKDHIFVDEMSIAHSKFSKLNLI